MTLKQARNISTQTLVALALALFPLSLVAHAQSADAKPTADDQAAAFSKDVDPCRAARNGPFETRTFYLANVSQQNDANEIMVAIRNMACPGDKIYLVASQQAIIVRASADQMALAEKIIHDLDRTRKTYRLTYTITQLDGGKPVGTEHLSMVIVNNQHTSLKEGNKVPVATGSYSDGSATASGVQTQFTYLDIGMLFDATLTEVEGGAMLKTKVEESSLDQPSTIAGVTEPVVRQTVFEGIAALTLDKPVMLGSVDVPTTTRRLDIAVVLEQVK